MEEYKKVIAIDFDGCLSANQWPEIGEPNWDVINRAKAEKDAGAELILWTCRTGEHLEAAVRACSEWGLEFDAVNENTPRHIEIFGEDCRKVCAAEYWDDHAVTVPAKSGWISVEERLPEKDKAVLVCLRDQQLDFLYSPCIGFLSAFDNEWRSYDYDESDLPDPVAFWMPLPEEPEEEEDVSEA